MKQKSLSRWLRMILLGVGICGLGALLWALPSLGQSLERRYPEFFGCTTPWMVLFWLASLPCWTALGLGWRVSGNIGRDRSFTMENAKLLRAAAILAAGDGAFFLVMNAIYLLCGLSHPMILLLSLLPAFCAMAVSVAAAALSHLVRKAAGLQDDSDLTI